MAGPVGVAMGVTLALGALVVAIASLAFLLLPSPQPVVAATATATMTAVDPTPDAPSVEPDAVPSAVAENADPSGTTPTPEGTTPTAEAGATSDPGPVESLGTPPPVVSGIGSVQFGTALLDGTLRDPHTDFAYEDTVVVKAVLRDTPGTRPLVFEIHRVDGATEERVRRELVPIGDPDGRELTRQIRLAEAVPGPGLYEVRYLRDGAALASGRILITT